MRYSWKVRRPHGDFEGPEVITCKDVRPFRFYIMEEAKFPGCESLKFESGQDLLSKIEGQHLGELFLYWQLRDHPWRTDDPMQAQLVFAPMFFGRLARQLCGDAKENIDHVTRYNKQELYCCTDEQHKCSFLLPRQC